MLQTSFLRRRNVIVRSSSTQSTAPTAEAAAAAAAVWQANWTSRSASGQPAVSQRIYPENSYFCGSLLSKKRRGFWYRKKTQKAKIRNQLKSEIRNQKSKSASVHVFWFILFSVTNIFHISKWSCCILSSFDWIWIGLLFVAVSVCPNWSHSG